LKKYFSPFLPFGPLVQPRLYLALLEEDHDDNEDEGGACGFLAFSQGGGGIEDCLGEGGIAGFSDGGIYDAHQVNRSALAPDTSSSSSPMMVEGLLAIFHICSAVALDLFSMSISTSFHFSFI
jgi:hypothetical protein